MAKRQPIDPKGNLWTDDKSECQSDLVKNNKQLKILYGNNTKSRHRQKRQSSQIKVICSVCGKEEMISPVLATGYNKQTSLNRYKCNDCLTRKKGRR